ncbi:MAG: DUF4332 domain-containing protein [Planctomyces sp.]|nr:DUF4332 domain-containing protein [Planctomyces sp.]
MSLLIRIVSGACCRSTHHRLAVDSLRFIAAGERWVNLFLRYHKEFLLGAKAPDDEFKDFRNHVLHVAENEWGGALASARQWYRATVRSLMASDWPTAVYSAGVMSHYLTDPFMPFHTGQSESEGAVHRAAEWSICKSWDELIRIAETDCGGYPPVPAAEGDEWLEELIRSGAKQAHQSYDLLIDHYDPVAGTKNPQAGMDDIAKHAISSLLTRAVVSLARAIDQAILEARAEAPEIRMTVPTLVASVNMPGRWIMNRLADRNDRAELQAILDEYIATGKVIEHLPADEKEVRQLHAREVLHVSVEELNRIPARPAGTQHSGITSGASSEPTQDADEMKGADKVSEVIQTPVQQTPVQQTPVQQTPIEQTPVRQTSVLREPNASDVVPARDAVHKKRRHFLELASPVVDAPSIGPKTADRLAEVGIQSVSDFLQADAASLAVSLAVNYINPKLIQDWQDQTRLAVSIPGVRGHDVQLLVASQVRTVEQLVEQVPQRLLNRVLSVALSPAGQRILRDSQPPDLEEVEDWISWARNARSVSTSQSSTDAA